MKIFRKRLAGERKWFDGARLGMFIHFGLYALRSSNENELIGGKGISKIAYERLQYRFNPKRFDADEWASLAKNNGFRYVVMTAKHTEGFCLWDSKHTRYKITNTPFKRDLFGELAAACRRQGLRFGVYYSFGEAHYEETGEGTPEGRTYAGYVEAQYKELMTQYGRIDCLWHDAPDKRLSYAFVAKLTDWVHKVQPGCVINARGLGLRQHNYHADYVTPERYIPGINGEHCPVECCDSMGQFAWGYRKAEQYWSAPELIRRLSRTASFHGNYLLNVGPMPDGRIAPECVERLKAIGRWLRVNSAAVYNTEACELLPREGFPAVLHDMDAIDDLPAIGVTTRLQNTFYLHLHTWPKGDTVLLQHLKGVVCRASILGCPKRLSANYGRVNRFGLDAARGNYGQKGVIVSGLPSEPVGRATAIIKLVLAPGWRIDRAAIKRERMNRIEILPKETVCLEADAAEFQEENGVPMVHAFKAADGRKRFCWLGRLDEKIVWHLKVHQRGRYAVWLESEARQGYGLNLSAAGQTIKYICDRTERKLGRRQIGRLELKAAYCSVTVKQLVEGKEGYFPLFTRIILQPIGA